MSTVLLIVGVVWLATGLVAVVLFDRGLRVRYGSGISWPSFWLNALLGPCALFATACSYFDWWREDA